MNKRKLEKKLLSLEKSVKTLSKPKATVIFTCMSFLLTIFLTYNVYLKDQIFSGNFEKPLVNKFDIVKNSGKTEFQTEISVTNKTSVKIWGSGYYSIEFLDQVVGKEDYTDTFNMELSLHNGAKSTSLNNGDEFLFSGTINDFMVEPESIKKFFVKHELKGSWYPVFKNDAGLPVINVLNIKETAYQNKINSYEKYVPGRFNLRLKYEVKTLFNNVSVCYEYYLPYYFRIDKEVCRQFGDFKDVVRETNMFNEEQILKTIINNYKITKATATIGNTTQGTP